MKIKRLAQIIICGLLLIMLAACGTNSKKKTTTSGSSSRITQAKKEKTLSKAELNKLDLPQLDEVVAKDQYVVKMRTSAGDIEIKLFPKQAKNTVENFITHAKNGYYNGTIFHRTVKDFMIQGGDPKGDGTGGESIWKGKNPKMDSGSGFKNEISNQLYNIRGALSMAHTSQPNSNGSQFFIVQNNKDDSDGLLSDKYPEKIIEAYKKGGYHQLDGKYTVFGQVIKGMDVVDKIANAEVKENQAGEKSTPVNPVKIEGIDILQEPQS